MKRIHTGRRWKVLAVIGGVVAAVSVGLVATTASAKSHDTTLNVSLFGDFGYHDLYKQYEAAHPGVTINESIQSYADHHTQLAQHIATGAGAADVEAIEVGFIPQSHGTVPELRRPRQYGASTLKNLYLPWKFQQAVGKGGAVVGLGTDVGSLAICYRKDLFAKAGLPTNRVAVVEALADVAGVHRCRQALPGEGPEGHALLRLGLERLQRDVRPDQPAVLRRRRQRDRGDESGHQGRVQPGHVGRAGGRVRRASRILDRLEHRLQEGRVRDRDLPRLDDGLHPGPGPGDEGQVGHRRRLPARAATGAGRSSPSRSSPRTRQRRPTWSSS